MSVIENQKKQVVLFEQLKVAERALEAACGCGCVCHQVRVGHEKRCCFANQVFITDIKEDIAKLHTEIRRLENGRTEA